MRMSNDGRPQMRDLVAERAKNDLITWSAWLCEYVKRVSAVMGLVFDSEKKEDDRSSKSSSAAARAPKFIRYDKPFVISSGQRENSRKAVCKKDYNDEGEGEESINNNNYLLEEHDLLTELINSFLTLQDTLEKCSHSVCILVVESTTGYTIT
ncbi:hypothetical protein YC2023_087535 [Brassica napus]